MSVIPARCLTSHDLSMLGHNTVAAAKTDRESRPPEPPEPPEPPNPPASGASGASEASFSTAGDEPMELEPFESVIDKALRSQHVAG